MSAIVSGFNVATMTSREIAELTGKELSNVHRDIRAMLDELKKDDSNLNHPQEDKDSRGYTVCFHLNRELTETLLTGYSATSRLRVIRRWHELEDQVSKPQLPDFSNPAIAARAWADKVEALQIVEAKKAELEHKVEVLAPKADALDRLATPTEGSVGLRIAAKLLQMPEKQFLQFANAKGYIFRNHMSRVWQGYNDKAKAGLVEQKITTIERDDGSTKTVEQVLITRLGLAKLALMLGVSGNDSDMELLA